MTDNETLTPEQAAKRLPTIEELAKLVRTLKPTILNDYRSQYSDPDDTVPSMDLTIGWSPETGAWGYQTGDNSYSGGAYGHPYWAVTVIDRRSNSLDIARDLQNQLDDMTTDNPQTVTAYNWSDDDMTTKTPQSVISHNPQTNARNLAGKKETIQTLQMVCAIVEPDGAVTLSTPIEVRWYKARNSDVASPVYCSVWVHHGDYPSGYGRANGYGYHKFSAALQEALHSAGFQFSHDFAGVGDSAIVDALNAVADHFGLPKSRILV